MSRRDWPWEYFYTMALTFLRLPEETFWAMTPRTLCAMIDEYTDIIKTQYAMQAHISRGGKIELTRDQKKEQETDSVFYDPFFC